MMFLSLSKITSLFPWAQFRAMKGAVTLHRLDDHDVYFQVFCRVTDEKVRLARVGQQCISVRP